jgi:hypothetical protein
MPERKKQLKRTFAVFSNPSNFPSAFEKPQNPFGDAGVGSKRTKPNFPTND